MSAPYSSPTIRHRAARLAPFIMIFGVCAGFARAEAPYALFQNSAIAGSGNTITAAQVPIVLGSGVTVYVNLKVQFDVDSSGNLTLAAGYPQVFASPSLLVSTFMAGSYVGPSAILGGEALITVAGPGVTDGGATEWSLTTPSGANACTHPLSATWYAGPLASNPLAARISKAGITSTAWSYGVATANQGCNTNDWGTDTLIGASQIGNTITFVSFTAGSIDQSQPVDQITYTLKP